MSYGAVFIIINKGDFGYCGIVAFATGRSMGDKTGRLHSPDLEGSFRTVGLARTAAKKKAKAWVEQGKADVVYLSEVSEEFRAAR